MSVLAGLCRRTGMLTCFAALLLAAGSLVLDSGAPLARAAEESAAKPKEAKPAKKKAAKKAADGKRQQLPDYFAEVVTDEQRAEIYKVQEKFAPKIDDLEAKLAALRDERDSAIRELLTPDQRKQVDKLAAEAKARRKAARQDQDVDKSAAK